MKFFKPLLILFIVLSCNKNDDNCAEHHLDTCNTDVEKTNIRIKNNSAYDFCNVVLNPEGRYTNYGEIKGGETSCYRVYEKAYRYAYVNLYIDGEEYIIQPIDYVGEQPLGKGAFTYLIDVSDINNNYGLSIIATRDWLEEIV